MTSQPGLSGRSWRCSGRRRPARARWPWRWRSGLAARSSTATPPPSSAASTSAPTRCRWPSAVASAHHLIDIVPPEADYNAADFARDAARVVGEMHARGTRAGSRRRVPDSTIRALTRGLFPGPGKDDADPRAAGWSGCPLWLRTAPSSAGRRVDPPSAERIQPRDRKRIVRALEVFFQTGKPLTAHFASGPCRRSSGDVQRHGAGPPAAR